MCSVSKFSDVKQNGFLDLNILICWDSFSCIVVSECDMYSWTEVKAFQSKTLYNLSSVDVLWTADKTQPWQAWQFPKVLADLEIDASDFYYFSFPGGRRPTEGHAPICPPSTASIKFSIILSSPHTMSHHNTMFPCISLFIHFNYGMDFFFCCNLDHYYCDLKKNVRNFYSIIRHLWPVEWSFFALGAGKQSPTINMEETSIYF